MKLQHAFRLAAVVAAFLAGRSIGQAAGLSIDLVHVGDAGNVADSTSNSSVDGGAGAVAYDYNIGKYDVTLNQYGAFLNAVAATDTYNLYDPQLGTDLNSAGISRSGSSGSYTYAVIGDGQRPVTYVNWYSAVRFTNWLTNGQGSGGTETGVYTLTGLTSIAPMPADHSALVGTGAKWFLPTEDEWYKAAYYKGGGTNAGYWIYPFKTDAEPTINLVPGDSNSANFYTDSNGYAVTQSQGIANDRNYLTPVGAYPSALSPYGSYDMGGDVYQWTETIWPTPFGPTQSVRGGGWQYYPSSLADWAREGDDANTDFSTIGFRVAELASVPEPFSIVLFACGALSVVIVGRRRMKARRAV